MYSSYIFAWLLQPVEEVLFKSPLLCKTPNKSASKRKFLISNDEAILTYWPLKNTFFIFYKRDSATFKL